MGTTTHREPEARDGGPLAVCVNDCKLDYGQASSELIQLCFQVQCAFAEMRWGSEAAAAFGTGASSIAQTNQSDINTSKKTAP
jgi:hypothetical protein